MKSHERDLRIGRLMRRTGISLLALAFTTGFVLRFIPLDPAVAWSTYIAVLAFIFLGAFLLYRGKQYEARGKTQATSDDDRAPVVYLRPFTADESMVGQVLPALLLPKMLSGFATHEEQLAEAVAAIGPLVAVGQPGEGLPKPGASRAYASDDQWKEVVNQWLSKARLVILQPGTSEGVQWEMGQAIKLVGPDRFLVLMIHVKRNAYKAFAECIRPRFGVVLPEFDAVRSWRRVSGFFSFSEDWTPRFLPLRAPYWRTSPYKGMLRLFNHALQPVVLRLGLPWRPSPISALRIFGLGLLVLPFVLCLVAGVVGLLADRRHYDFREFEKPADIVALDWRESKIAGLLISTPCELEAARFQELEGRWDLMQQVANMHTYRGNAGPLEILVTRCDFKPEVQLSIEGAVRGYISGIAEQGVEDFEYATTQSRISTYPATRVSTQFVLDGQKHRTEALIFAIQQSLSEVHVGFADTTASLADAQRILASVMVAQQTDAEHLGTERE